MSRILPGQVLRLPAASRKRTGQPRPVGVVSLWDVLSAVTGETSPRPVELRGLAVARFGWRLYRTFFKTYTEKVWGVPVNEMPSDWAAQRIKNLDLGKAVLNALTPKRNQQQITSLIEEFQYPKFGPGMMWERCRDLVESGGGTVLMGTKVVSIGVEGGRATGVTVRDPDGSLRTLAASHVISSMPMNSLVDAIDPPPPEVVLSAGRSLLYRDFLTVARWCPRPASSPTIGSISIPAT